MILSRRHFLRGTGALVTLPWLESFAPRRGPGAEPPVRAVWLYFPNGVSEGSWEPAEVGPKGELVKLNPRLAPLARHRSNLVMTRNLWTPRGNNHGAGTATWLTGMDWDEQYLDAGGPSVDQVAARAVGQQCVAPALSLRTRGEGSFSGDVSRNCISWHAARRPVFREIDPRVIFRLLFGGGARSDGSLLDDLRQQASDLRRNVSRVDQERLDGYLDAVRELERRIAFVQDEATARRLASAREHGLTFDAEHPIEAVPEDHGAYLDLLFDLTALALWSGASRVATMMLDHGQSNRYCPFIPGVQGTWHALSHWKDASGRLDDDDGFTRWSSVDSKKEQYDRVVTWHHERVARFLDRLAALPEGPDGGRSMLDQTLVIYGSSIADGYDHGEENLPVLLAGSAGGAVRTGRQLDPGPRTDLARLHLATLHLLGASTESFGEAREPLNLG